MSIKSTDKWTIKNFKALTEAEIDPNLLNYVTGTNSSGKSSYLQSLLLMAQSLDEDINLNGYLTRLGRGVDIIKSGEESVLFRYSSNYFFGGDKEYKLEIVIKSDKNKNNASNVYISDFKIIEEGQVVISASDDRVGNITRKDFSKYLSEKSSLLKIRSVNGEQINSTWLSFKGFLPTNILMKRNIQSLKKNISNILRSERPSYFQRYLLIENMKKLAKEEMFHDKHPVKILAEQNPENWPLNKQKYIENTAHFVAERYHLKSGHIQVVPFIYNNISVGSFSSPEYYEMLIPENYRFYLTDQDIKLKRLVEETAGGLKSLISKLVYVGPLREEPQVLSISSGIKNNTPVGVKGELTADLLLKNKNRKIQYVSPKFEEKKSTLLEAVNEWVDSLDIGNKIKTRDEGKLGRGIVLKMKGDRQDRDLTQIGVGASQLLPILTVVLNSPTGSIVLLEQPELHLHPAVQSRLGDFFLAQSLYKGFIIETHSEYLITRARLQKVKDKSNSENINFYFVEVSDHGDHDFIKLGNNKFGDLDYWPKGFFDTLEEDSAAIVAHVRGKILDR